MSDKRIEPLWGAKAIAQRTGTSLRRTFYLLEQGHIPARKVGNVWLTTSAEVGDFLLGRVTPSQQREVA
jgi:hypothetical protein